MSRPCTQILMALAGLAALTGFAAASPGLDACLTECKRSQLSMTNRATCRLDCEVDAASDPEQIRARMAPASRPAARPDVPTPAASAGPPNGLGCKAACAADSSLSVDDRATCTLECDLEPAPMPTGTPPPMRPPRLAPEPTPPPGPTPMPGRAAGLTWRSAGPVAADAALQSGFLAKCHATCKSGPSPREVTDFETCKLDCDMMASVLDVASGFVPDAWLEVPRPIATRDPTPVSALTTSPTPTKPVVEPRLPSTAPAKPVGTPSSEPEPDTCAAVLSRCNTRCAKAEASCRRACGRKQGSETDRETCKLGCGTDLEVCQGDCLTDHATCVNNQRGP
jgi:hypothetical protein